jgi:polyphosphate kinase
MVEAMIRAVRLLPWLLLTLAWPSAAHRLDEYLQAMLVVIEPSSIQLQINLTPGVEVADQVLARIDRDDDRVISKDEAGAYAELLKRDLSVRLDGHNVGLELTGYECPKPSELRSGLQIIQVEFTAICDFDAGPHKLIVENSHVPTASVYLFNAAKSKSGAVQVISQNRNNDQSVGEIECILTPPSDTSKTAKSPTP